MPESLLDQLVPSDSQTTRLWHWWQRGKFLAKTFKKKPFVLETGDSPGELVFGKGVGGCGARCAPSRAVPPPGPILRALPRSPRWAAALRGAGHASVPSSTPGWQIPRSGVQQAVGAPDTQQRRGRAGRFLLWLSSFPSILERGEDGRVPSALAARADHLPPRMAGAGRLYPAQSSPAATRPAPMQPAGRAGHAGTCSLRGRGRGPRAGAARKPRGPEGKGRGRGVEMVR